jgi:hypothetical protein
LAIGLLSSLRSWRFTILGMQLPPKALREPSHLVEKQAEQEA